MHDPRTTGPQDDGHATPSGYSIGDRTQVDKIVLSSDGITLERDANKVIAYESNVSMNDGALEVT